MLRTRFRLLICLLPIIASWLYLAFAIPITNFGSGGGVGFGPSPLKDRVALTCGQSGKTGWEQCLLFDIRTGQMSHAAHPSFARPMVCLDPLAEFTRNGQEFKRWRVATIDRDTEQVASFADFDFPANHYPRMVGGRFAVTTEATTTLVVDTHASEPVVVSHATPHLEGYGGLREIGDTRRFLRNNSDVMSPRNNLLPSCWIELFEINDDGIPNLINRWQALCDSGGGWHFTLIDENLISVHPTNGTFEIRSQVDGTLIASHVLPSGFDPATQKWYFNSDVLTVGSGIKSFSFRTHRWVKVPEGYYSYYEDSPGNTLRLWSEPNDEGNQSQMVVTDVDTDDEVARFSFSEPIQTETFLDEERIVFVTSRWGYTLGMVNARTGELMNVWRPYWWVFPAMLISVSAYMVWCVAWVKSTSPTNRWAWADVAFVSSIPIAALSIRAKFAGDYQDISREPYAIIEGIFIAVFFLASLWVWSARKRLVQRALPMMLSLAALATLLNLIFDDKIAVASSILLPNLLIAMASMIASLGLKLAGWQLDQPHAGSQLQTANTSLKEIFILVAVSALMFAPMRSIIPDLSNAFVALNQWIYMALLVAVPMLACVLAINANRYIYNLGIWLTIGLVGFLQLYLYYHFVEGTWLFRFYNTLDSVLILVPSAFVATFVLSIALCRRGEESRSSW